MAITSVKATINNVEYTLVYNSSTGKYEKSVTAPGATSYNLSGGNYNVSVTATNTAGTSTTVDGTTMPSLRLVVKETVKPVISLISPSDNARITNAQPSIVFTVTDESGGSGVKLSTVKIKIDSGSATVVNNYTAITNGYQFTYTPSSALSNGSHSLTLTAEDHDGNVANSVTSTFVVDTVAPTLDVTAPTDNLITSQASCVVQGTTNDATSSPVGIAITLNGVDVGTVSVSSGTFTKTITLASGSNTIVVTATDSAGLTTSITRTVTLDTSAPTIVSATVTPNPATTGATVLISVEVV